MKWNEVSEKYRNKWFKLLILNSHESENKEYINDMDVLTVLSNEDVATDELVNCYEKEKTKIIQAVK